MIYQTCWATAVQQSFYFKVTQNSQHFLPGETYPYEVFLVPINVYGHITLNTQVLIRSLKLSKVELCYYLDGWLSGNRFLPLIQFLTIIHGVLTLSTSPKELGTE